MMSPTLKSFSTLFFTLALLASTAVSAQDSDQADTAIFAGGCFWCMEKPFDDLPGVLESTSGYIGGHVENPTYEQVSSGHTGHLEAVLIRYLPSQISYPELLKVFWHNIDPTDASGQFCDKGSQYTSAIFYGNKEQKRQAEASRQALIDSGALGQAPLVTALLPATQFYPAEKYHQNYYQKNPVRYHFYRYRCGRDQRLEELWGETGH